MKISAYLFYRCCPAGSVMCSHANGL